MKISIAKRSRKSIVASFLLIALMTFHFDALASHLRAGNITVSRQSCTSSVYLITLTVYTNDLSSVKFSDNHSGTLNFGDKSPVFHPDRNLGVPVPGFDDPAFKVIQITIPHNYSGGRYTISYVEPNRNGNIVNMDDSFDTPFYIETVISIDQFSNVCESSPVFKVPPLDKACTGVRWRHDPGAYDLDFDSLSYELVTPKQSRTAVVNGFRQPNDRGFYAGKNYNTSNQDKNGPPTFSISQKGVITWDSPGLTGEYNIAFHVIEWRQQPDGTYLQVGFVRRDMQIIVQDCDNLPPILTLAAPNVCVEAGKTVGEDITASDPEGSAVKIEAFSLLLDPTFHITATAAPTIFQATSPGVPAVLHFSWQTQCKDVIRQPYQVVFKATDQPKDLQQQLIDFSVMSITVVGPAPIWNTGVTPLPNHQAQLAWKPYACSPSAVIMQVWRRVESLPYTPPECQTGMPAFLGFTKIAEVDISKGTTSFKDTNGTIGLAPGTQYCYRLVAAWPSPAGGLSYVSEERCFTTRQDAPIITNVSIDLTDPANGQDTIKWVAPLKSDIDTVAFPAPYAYEVYRAEGLSGGSLTKVIPGKVSNTFLIDNDNDTQNKTFHYEVVAYASNDAMIDHSADASTVRLDLRPGVTSIELNWNAEVPWSNLIAKKHLIYRGPEGSTTINQLQLIDSVDVLKDRFHYIDSGKFGNVPLDNSKIYCYCVRTAGSYGNVNIPQTLFNYSQISCAQPNDTIPPCKVTINAKGTDCDNIYKNICKLSNYSNTLTWKTPTLDCTKEAYRYNIYVAAQTGGDYVYKTTVSDTFFIDSNLTSFARCYKVSAVSRSLIEGPLSDPFCFDNCPYFEMPNVFTPGNRDNCNDLFSAYSDRPDSIVSSCKQLSDEEVKLHCARFVNGVNFTVLNRWGKEVYNYSSGGENTYYVDWDGRDNEGKEVSAGVYYFIAEVDFDVVDPKKRARTIKGWVQVIR